jgi:1,4-dihydroxy-2-naphthoate octaprenyltransferase
MGEDRTIVGGTLPAGAISLRTTLVFGLGSAAIGLAAGLLLLSQIGSVLIPYMVVGAVLVLGYTDAIARIGLGEIAAGLGLGTLPVAGTALVQDGTVGPAAVAAAIPAGLMTFNLLLLNEFPDEEADRKGGRRNLVILLGRRRAARIYGIAALATPASIVASVVAGALPAVCLAAVLPSLLLVPALKWVYSDTSKPVPLPALGGNVTWNLATNSLLAVALVMATLLF